LAKVCNSVYGLEVDTQLGIPFSLETIVMPQLMPQPVKPAAAPRPQRMAERREVRVPARLTWKDQRGMVRFASVVTRNVSERGVLVESTSPLSIPLFRLVQFQLEPSVREDKSLPATLRDGRSLSAVYRIEPPAYSGARHAIALRLMVDPKRAARETEVAEASRATA
jgi:hypothetical protein